MPRKKLTIPQVDRPTYIKKEGSLVEPQLFVIRRQFVGDATYGKQFGDAGLIVNLLNTGNDEKLIRIGYLEKYDGRDKFECGRCGNWFASMDAREAHGRKRHSPSKRRILDLDQLTEAQKRQLIADTEEYATTPQDFHVPDPEDSEIAAEERVWDNRAPLRLDQTAASRQ